MTLANTVEISHLRCVPHITRLSYTCRVIVPRKRERHDGCHHDYLLVSDLYTKDKRPAVPRNSSRGGDHVLRGAHERNCACAPCLSLNPTHVTQREESPSVALFPLVLVAMVAMCSPCAQAIHAEMDMP